MRVRFSKTLLTALIIFLFLSLFLSSKSKFLDSVISHYASYYASYPVRAEGCHLSSLHEFNFDMLQIGEDSDGWRTQIISGRFSVAKLSHAFFAPRRIYFYAQALRTAQHDGQLSHVRGYIVSGNSRLRVNLNRADFEDMHFKGGALFVSGELKKANIVIASPKKISDYLGSMSKYLEALKQDNSKLFKAKITYAEHQIMLRGSRKPIASFSWSPGS